MKKSLILAVAVLFFSVHAFGEAVTLTEDCSNDCYDGITPNSACLFAFVPYKNHDGTGACDEANTGINVGSTSNAHDHAVLHGRWGSPKNVSITTSNNAGGLIDISNVYSMELRFQNSTSKRATVMMKILGNPGATPPVHQGHEWCGCLHHGGECTNNGTSNGFAWGSDSQSGPYTGAGVGTFANTCALIGCPVAATHEILARRSSPTTNVVAKANNSNTSKND